MSGSANIDILLATWNGERYLKEQIDSILAQTYPHWRLLVRDDGSTDRTPEILAHYATAEPERIVLITDQDCNLGACRNFARLMEHTRADYVMFADQDDVWLPDKTARLLTAMATLEAQYGRDMPLLVHSDLKVVGPDLEEWHPSFLKYQALDPASGRFLNRLLVQNVVTGCASLCNRALIERGRPVPPGARMHDWWLALVAAAFGRIGFVAEPTVLYRQHGANALGAKNYAWPNVLRLTITAPVASWTRAILRATQRQAGALLTAYRKDLDEPTRHLLESYVAIPNQGFFTRRLTLLKHGFLGSNLYHKLAFFVFV